MSSKTCSRCGEDKPLEDYYKQQLTKRAPFCKDCRRDAMKARRKRGQKYRKARDAEQRARVNALKMTLKCTDCGWSPTSVEECWKLHFDHVDPATKWEPEWKGASARRAAFRVYWSWDRIMAEIALCEPRCHSCHASRTQRQRHGLDPYPLPWSRTSPTPPWSTPSPDPSPANVSAQGVPANG